MKKIIFTLALFVQVGFAMADNNAKVIARPRQDNVQMFQQPGTAATSLTTLQKTDRVTVVRKHNAHWVIVEANGKTGYVLLSELAALKTQK